MTKKLWGGRFTGANDPLMEAFNASISFDKRMWRADLTGSQAYARALARSGIITSGEAETLVAGLELVADEWTAGAFELRPGDEDIHTANERRLTELLGDVAGKLHTGRSRNDQVATDPRLWLLGEIVELRRHLRELIRTATDRAAAEIDLLMPGYTHLQPAQPTRWSHWLLSHAWAWQRDAQRLDELSRTGQFPAAGQRCAGGQSLWRGPGRLAADWALRLFAPNSLDAVSDRDFVAEFLFWATLTMLHLSRWAEDLIIYSSREFGFVTWSDAYSTGSSLMPQKKNPDALELLRGKSGRVLGQLTGLMTSKGLPSTYNKDLQEDKEPLFDAVETLRGFPSDCQWCAVDSDRQCGKDARHHGPEMLATDLAEYLVRKGVPFRETHHVAGAAVQMAEVQALPLPDLSLDDLRTLHKAFAEDVEEVWSFERSVERRDVMVAPATVRSWLRLPVCAVGLWRHEPSTLTLNWMALFTLGQDWHLPAVGDRNGTPPSPTDCYERPQGNAPTPGMLRRYSLCLTRSVIFATLSALNRLVGLQRRVSPLAHNLHGTCNHHFMTG